MPRSSLTAYSNATMEHYSRFAFKMPRFTLIAYSNARIPFSSPTCRIPHFHHFALDNTRIRTLMSKVIKVYYSRLCYLELKKTL